MTPGGDEEMWRQWDDDDLRKRMIEEAVKRGPLVDPNRAFEREIREYLAGGAPSALHHHAAALLHGACGLDAAANPDLAATPERMVRALEEMTAGRHEDPAAILERTFDAGGYDELVAVRGIEFTSLCEHHVLPFVGRAHVAYLPGARVVGLSKLPRLVDCFARRLQMQERLTAQVADAIVEHLGPKGAAVVVEARHECMACRGVKKATATMVTSAIRGVFRENDAARAEVMGLLLGTGGAAAR